MVDRSVSDDLKARLTKVLARELAKPYCLNTIVEAAMREISEYAWNSAWSGYHYVNPFLRDLDGRPFGWGYESYCNACGRPHRAGECQRG